MRSCATGTVSLLVLALHTPLLYIFTHDPEILSAAAKIMDIDFFVELPRAVNHVSENSFNANGLSAALEKRKVAECPRLAE